jgi:MOSC domain-containing protein YiiM
MKLLAISIGASRPVPGRKTQKSGIYKEPVDHSVLVGREGLAGDRIVNRKHHGGPDQAVYIEGEIDYAWWRQELGLPLPPGTFGENLLIEGVDNRELAVGDRFEIGDVVLELTSARMPCATFAARMGDSAIVKRYTRAARPGAYARVIREGSIRAGDAVRYLPFAGPRVTMPDLMRTYGRKLEGEERQRYLAAPIHHKLRAFLSE